MPGAGATRVGSLTLAKVANTAHGGGNGFFRGYPSDGTEAVATEQGTPSLKVDVTAFRGFLEEKPVDQGAAASPNFSIPSANPRIDLLQWKHGEGLNIKEGVEAGSPSPPSADSDALVLYEIYCRTTMSVIKTTDDSTNGYVSTRKVEDAWF